MLNAFDAFPIPFYDLVLLYITTEQKRLKEVSTPGF